MTTSMPSTPPADVIDVIDQIVPLNPAQSSHGVRHQRAKVVAATQGSYEAMFAPTVQGITVAERLLVALYACRLSGADSLAVHYRQRLVAENADRVLVDAVDRAAAATIADARLETMLRFTATLIERPIEGDRQAVTALVDAGLSTPAIVALGQLIGFLSYQIRLAAGLKAMVAAELAA